MQRSLFPQKVLRITQQAFYTYSHGGSPAVDTGDKDTGKSPVYAPFDLVIKRVRLNATGEVYLESTEPVILPDGTTDYVHILLIHGDNRHLKAGQIVKQGVEFYSEGGWGNGSATAFSNHLHIEAGKGKWENTTQFQNSQGTWMSENLCNIADLFFLEEDTIIIGDDFVLNTDGSKTFFKTVTEEEPMINEELKGKPLKIGYASKGDLSTVSTELSTLNVSFQENTDTSGGGYIYVTYGLTGGDFDYIYNLCVTKGLPVVEYTPEPAEPSPAPEPEITAPVEPEIEETDSELEKKVADLTEMVLSLQTAVKDLAVEVSEKPDNLIELIFGGINNGND